MNLFILLNTKEDILKMSATKQLISPIDFHNIFSHMEVNGVHQLWLSKVL